MVKIFKMLQNISILNKCCSFDTILIIQNMYNSFDNF